MSNLRRARGDLKRALVVDDEADIRELLDMTLARMGLAADCAANVTEARRLLAENSYQVCLTDMRLPDGDGLELVRFIGEQCPELPVAVITAHGSMENAVAALKAGAFDYLSKPVSLDQLRVVVRAALNLPGSDGGSVAGNEHDLRDLLGASPAIVQVRDLVERVSRSQAPVYITGESGSGKELAARMIHERSARQTKTFVPVNCGAIPENLVEAEFFGYRKGAFTGADNDRIGFFQAADGGTLFLDEVADLPLAMQVKLLRAIQERRVRKVGATAEDAVDVRVICATHQNLKSLVDQGRFRQDLFYRLNVIEIRMPALRECSEDVDLLADHMLARMARNVGIDTPRLTDPARQALSAYAFPGNVRELENILERAVALLDGDIIDTADLGLERDADVPAPANLHSAADSGQESGVPLAPQFGQSTLQDYLDQVEKTAILEALDKTRFNRTAAARLLGVSFRSLRYRMQRLGLND